jgi:glycosyltransferase involved in cell wall biosynthesis
VFGAYLRTVGRWTYNVADVAFTYTDPERTALRELGIKTDITVIANGIDTTRFTPIGTVSNHIVRDTPVVLFVGRFTEGKRPADAIKAIARVRSDYPNVRLYLAGDGERRGNLERLATERGIDEAVTFLGHVDYDEMPALYRAADVLVLPSRAEGLPRTVLEALATETPVVTSDLPQLRPLTDKAGHAVPVGNNKALASALADIISNPVRAKQLGVRGRELVTERHRWAETVERTTERLERLAGE